MMMMMCSHEWGWSVQQWRSNWEAREGEAISGEVSLLPEKANANTNTNCNLKKDTNANEGKFAIQRYLWATGGMNPSSRKRKNILTDDERAGDLKGFVRIGMIDQQFWDFWRIDRDFDLDNRRGWRVSLAIWCVAAAVEAAIVVVSLVGHLDRRQHVNHLLLSWGNPWCFPILCLQ